MVNDMKKRINEALQSKTFYIIFALAISIALWAYVDRVDNPDVTVPYNNIDIQFEGNENLEENDLILTGCDVQEVSMRLTGKRGVLKNINSSNIVIKVDLNDIIDAGTGTGIYQLNYSIEYPTGVTPGSVKVSEASVDYVTVKIERLIEKKIGIKGTYSGYAEQGYQAGPLEFDPEYIVVSGPDSIVYSIDHAKVTLEVGSFAKTIKTEVPFTVVDKDDNEIASDNLKFSVDTVNVTIPVLMEKEITLKYKPEYTNSATEANVSVSITPEKIKVSGDPEILNKMSDVLYLTLSEDLCDFAVYYSENVDIEFPDGVTSVTGETSAKVIIRIDGMTTKTFTVKNLKVSNVTDGLTASVITQSKEITVRGPAESLDKIKASDIVMTADLAELDKFTGQTTVIASCYIPGASDVDVLYDYELTVRISKG